MSLAHAPDMDVLRLKMWAKEIRFRLVRGLEPNDAFDAILTQYPLTWSVLSVYIAQLNSIMARRLSDYPELQAAFPEDLRGLTIKVAVSVIVDRSEIGGATGADWTAIKALAAFLPKFQIDEWVF